MQQKPPGTVRKSMAARAYDLAIVPKTFELGSIGPGHTNCRPRMQGNGMATSVLGIHATAKNCYIFVGLLVIFIASQCKLVCKAVEVRDSPHGRFGSWA